ncbi:MAG: RAD55 family ATPase [Thermoplasmata archaeon]
MQRNKIKTGIPGLDEMLHGGLIPQRPYIISGQLGSGKTTLAMQFLLEGVRNGENVLYITTEEPPNEIKLNFENFKWDISKIKVFDAIPDVMTYEITPIKDITALREIVAFKDVPYVIRKTPEHGSPEMTFNALQNALKLALSTSDYDRIVVDSLTALKFFCIPSYDHNLGVQSFIRFLSELKVTALLTVEMPLEYQFEPELFLARGEIRLLKWRDKDGELKRGVLIEKYKGSSHDVHIRPMEITPEGIVVYSELHVEKSPLEAYLEMLPVEEAESEEEKSVEEPKPSPHGEKTDTKSETVTPSQTQAPAQTPTLAQAPAEGTLQPQKIEEKSDLEKWLKELKILQEDVADADLIGVDVADLKGLVDSINSLFSLGKVDEAMHTLASARKLLDERINMFHSGKVVEKVSAESGAHTLEPQPVVVAQNPQAEQLENSQIAEQPSQKEKPRARGRKKKEEMPAAEGKKAPAKKPKKKKESGKKEVGKKGRKKKGEQNTETNTQSAEEVR